MKMTEQERRALFFNVTGHVYAHSPMGEYQAFCKGLAAGAAAEREKVAAWMMQRGYATGHGESTEDLLAELDWQVAENWTLALVKGVEGEREACAKVCEDLKDSYDGSGETFTWCAHYIRARGQQ